MERLATALGSWRLPLSPLEWGEGGLIVGALRPEQSLVRVNLIDELIFHFFGTFVRGD